jgi:biotin synthase-related radical SAM superfamily protein
MSRAEAFAKAAEVVGKAEGVEKAGLYRVISGLTRRFGSEEKAWEMLEKVKAAKGVQEVSRELGIMAQTAGDTFEEKMANMMEIFRP